MFLSDRLLEDDCASVSLEVVVGDLEREPTGDNEADPDEGLLIDVDFDIEYGGETDKLCEVG